MGSNVIRLSSIAVQPYRKEVRKVIKMPNLFTVLIDAYKKKQDEIKQKKIETLTQAAFRHYLDLLESETKIFKTQVLNEIDLPEFMYRHRREQIAKEKASEVMMDVIENNRVDECYRQYKKFLKQNKRRGK